MCGFGAYDCQYDYQQCKEIEVLLLMVSYSVHRSAFEWFILTYFVNHVSFTFMVSFQKFWKGTEDRGYVHKRGAWLCSCNGLFFHSLWGTKLLKIYSLFLACIFIVLWQILVQGEYFVLVFATAVKFSWFYLLCTPLPNFVSIVCQKTWGICFLVSAWKNNKRSPTWRNPLIDLFIFGHDFGVL